MYTAICQRNPLEFQVLLLFSIIKPTLTPIMKILNFYLLTVCLFLTFSSQAQKWKKNFDPVQYLRFCEIHQNENGTTTLLTRTSFTEHQITVLDGNGNIESEKSFVLPILTFRPFDYISLGFGDFAVLCRSNILSSDVVRVIKFNESGGYYWLQNISSEEYDIRPIGLSVLENGNIATMGIAQKYINSNDDQEIFMVEQASLDGSLVQDFISNTPAQFSAGIRVQKADNGNYICLEGENFENAINTFGGPSIRYYYINELAPEGEVIKRVRLGEWVGSTPHQSHLEYLSQDSIIVVTDRDVYLLDNEFNSVWHRKTDLSIQDVKVNKSSGIIAITGRTFGNVDNRSASILLIDFEGNVISSKTHTASTNIASSVDEYGIDIVDGGYVIGTIRKNASAFNILECLKTDELGLIDKYEVYDIYRTCDQYPLPPPSFSIPEYDCSENSGYTTSTQNSNSNLACIFNILSERITTVERIVTDSCGAVDTVIQLIHYQGVKPTANCCDFTIQSQNADGAVVQFGPITINSPCRAYDLIHLDSFDLNGPVYFETGTHSINFLFVNDGCSRLDSFYQSFTIDISFVDLDGDGFEASVDCDDDNPDINPGQMEVVYNGIDDDCDESTLDDDLDQDGFLLADDCDDDNPDIHPDQDEEVYNGIDDDCDESTLDDDLDQDGFVLADDCDDDNPDIHPNQDEEVYNGIDDDCDESTLDDDLDQDGFVLADDCDDNNPDIHPDQDEEVYNGIDDDCDETTFDDDLDQDGFVLVDDCNDEDANINPNQMEEPYNGIDDDCDEETLDDDLDQDGFLLADDCDDMDASINPNAIEIPNNGIDEDCDGSDLIVSVKELSNSLINVYPNPASEFILIEVEGDLKYKVNIYDINGKLLISSVGLNVVRIDDLSQGTYLVEIKDLNSEERVVERIIVSNF